ncbi:MAG: hypothetical protein ACYCOO_10930 [Chitinophagaceae bacterium]
MKKTNLHLLVEERELVMRTDWIEMKNQILGKVMGLFGELASGLSHLPKLAEFPFPAECLKNGPKISRGEKYEGLPYVILDYPRLFSREDIFAFRTFFWWGNFFSCTLHLAGKSKEVFAPCIKSNFNPLQKSNFFVGVQKQQWHHHFASSNYLPLENMDFCRFCQILDEKNFIKLSVRFPLEIWEQIIPEIEKTLPFILQCLKKNSST